MVSAICAKVSNQPLQDFDFSNSTSTELLIPTMAPTAISAQPSLTSSSCQSQGHVMLDQYSKNRPDNVNANPISPIRAALISEQTPLAVRFRALFSLKHYASEQPPTSHTIPAIEAIAAAFGSPSALLKHELAYCLGQTRNLAAVPFLRSVLEDEGEDTMCRHEAAEALGALGDRNSLSLLERLRDDIGEAVVVKETCDIAVQRIKWEHSAQRRVERIRDRYGFSTRYICKQMITNKRVLVISHQSIQPRRAHKPHNNNRYQSSSVNC